MKIRDLIHQNSAIIRYSVHIPFSREVCNEWAIVRPLGISPGRKAVIIRQDIIDRRQAQSLLDSDEWEEVERNEEGRVYERPGRPFKSAVDAYGCDNYEMKEYLHTYIKTYKANL